MDARITTPLRIALLVCCVTLGAAGPWGFVANPRVLEFPVCANQRVTKPCKIIIPHHSASEDDIISRSRQDGQICTCPGQSSCPIVWGEDPERTLSFYINLDGRQTAVQYKFCEPITGDRPCIGDEIVASLGGHSLIPSELEVKNCKCPTDDPMHLKQIVTSGFRKRQDYVCSMPTCNVNRSGPQQCMTLTNLSQRRSQTLEHQCECPDGKICRIQPGDLMNASADQPVNGYCRRL